MKFIIYCLVLLSSVYAKADRLAEPAKPADLLGLKAKPLSLMEGVPAFYKVNVGAAVPFQIGLQGQYYFPKARHYYAKAGAGFNLSLFMQIRERLHTQLGFPADEYEQTLIDLMTHGVVWDARLGWAQNMEEGPYFEFGYRLMVWGEELSLSAERIQKTFQHKVSLNMGEGGPQAGRVLYTDMLNHGPTMHIGYSFALVDQFFLNMEWGVYKPLFGLAEVSAKNVLNKDSNSEIIYPVIRRDLWIISLGLWLSFLF